MHFFAISAVVQLLCVIHVIKTGGNKLWIMGILAFPFLGAAAYFLLEILPGMQGNRHMRYAKKVAVDKIDPEKSIRNARERQEMTDSLANRIELADAFAVSGRHEDAVREYKDIIAKPHGDDERTLFKYAASLFEMGQSEQALGLLQNLEPKEPGKEADRRALLHARILAELGREGEALTIFEDIVERMAGIKARGYYAAVLLKSGNKAEAKTQLSEILRTVKNMDLTQLGDDKQISDWAAAELEILP